MEYSKAGAAKSRPASWLPQDVATAPAATAAAAMVTL
jgi:hypothetical protein